jgi:hypothetical protein
LPEFVEIPERAQEPKPLFPDLPGFPLVREVREWVSKNPTYMWRGHTHTMPSKTDMVEFVGMFERGTVSVLYTISHEVPPWRGFQKLS